jgi:hypothetical protein
VRRMGSLPPIRTSSIKTCSILHTREYEPAWVWPPSLVSVCNIGPPGTKSALLTNMNMARLYFVLGIDRQILEISNRVHTNHF